MAFSASPRFRSSITIPDNLYASDLSIGFDSRKTRAIGIHKMPSRSRLSETSGGSSWLDTAPSPISRISFGFPLNLPATDFEIPEKHRIELREKIDAVQGTGEFSQSQPT